MRLICTYMYKYELRGELGEFVGLSALLFDPCLWETASKPVLSRQVDSNQHKNIEVLHITPCFSSLFVRGRAT